MDNEHNRHGCLVSVAIILAGLLLALCAMSPALESSIEPILEERAMDATIVAESLTAYPDPD